MSGLCKSRRPKNRSEYFSAHSVNSIDDAGENAGVPNGGLKIMSVVAKKTPAPVADDIDIDAADTDHAVISISIDKIQISGRRKKIRIGVARSWQRRKEA
jgi:hypothetical protein